MTTTEDQEWQITTRILPDDFEWDDIKARLQIATCCIYYYSEDIQDVLPYLQMTEHVPLKFMICSGKPTASVRDYAKTNRIYLKLVSKP